MDVIQNDLNNPKQRNKKSRVGLFLVGCTGALAVGISVISAPFVSPAFRRVCIPYVPASEFQVQNVFKALRGRHGSFVDLGSGDGRISIEAAKKGFIASGIELNRWLVLYSRLSSRFQGVSRTCSFKKADLWKTNLHSYDNIVIFGVSEMMESLEEKLLKEVKTGSCVAACRFPLPNISPSSITGEGIDSVWCYNFPRTKTTDIHSPISGDRR